MQPMVLAYYFDGTMPTPHRIRDVSATGAFLLTKERWYRGTIIRLAIDRRAIASEHGPSPDEADTLVVQGKVVRHELDGVGLQFVLRTREQKMSVQKFVEGIRINESEGVRNFQEVATSGNSLVEFALILPLLLLLFVNAVNFGSFIYGWIVVANAARAGGQYFIMGGANVGSPAPASPTQVINLITADTTALLNNSTVAVCVSTNNNGVTSSSGTCTGANAGAPVPEAAAEAASYVVASIDVQYTYQPLIPLWDFSGLGIHATLPPTTIHRRAVMRMIQ